MMRANILSILRTSLLHQWLVFLFLILVLVWAFIAFELN